MAYMTEVLQWLPITSRSLFNNSKLGRAPKFIHSLWEFV